MALIYHRTKYNRMEIESRCLTFQESIFLILVGFLNHEKSWLFLSTSETAFNTPKNILTETHSSAEVWMGEEKALLSFFYDHKKKKMQIGIILPKLVENFRE